MDRYSSSDEEGYEDFVTDSDEELYRSESIKDQIYHEKRTEIQHQMQQLHQGTLPEFVKMQKKLETAYKDRQRRIQQNYSFQLAKFEKEQQRTLNEINEQFEKEKEIFKKKMITDLEEKVKQLEQEKSTYCDLHCHNSVACSLDVGKTPKLPTRNLRPREQKQTKEGPEMKRKREMNSLVTKLTDEQIEEDLKAIRSAVHAKLEKQRKLNSEQPRIQDNKLYYEKQWYHIGNNVQVCSHRDQKNFLAQIYDITTKDIMLKTVPFNKQSIKYKFGVSLLKKGKYSIKKEKKISH